MSTLRLLISDSYDPWFNLAVEECIFRQMPATQRVLFLWRNADTVVIGRAQNPWKECNTRRMEEDNVRLARRSSGGGAVFHDLGNTCFTFMAGKPEYDKTISTSIVLNALNALGVSAEASGRNDLVVKTAEGDRKVSGSAYRETKDRGFHHGTLLLNADLSRLANYLNPDKKKLAAKGITSVRSRVTNLTELLPGITHEQVCEAITEAFFAHYGEHVEAEIISPDKTPDLPNFAETFARQSSWEWNFGQAPAFSHLLDERFTWGGVELHFDVEKGHITRAQVFTDSLNPAPLEALAGRLQGCLYRADMLQQECEALLVDFPEQEKELRELSAWIAGRYGNSLIKISREGNMIDLENQEREVINLMFSQGISWLAAVRIRHKLSLAEVSKMLGISINSLKRIEKTERLSSNIKRKWQEFMVVHQSC